MKYAQSTLLTTVAKALPHGQRLPKFDFDPHTSEWTAESRASVGIGHTLEESLSAWCQNAKTIAQEQYGEGDKWTPALALLDGYAGPLDLDLLTPNHQPEDWSGL